MFFSATEYRKCGSVGSCYSGASSDFLHSQLPLTDLILIMGKRGNAAFPLDKQKERKVSQLRNLTRTNQKKRIMIEAIKRMAYSVD